MEEKSAAVFCSLVALPSADVPLQIFEARYRVLFSTLLAGETGINEGLVQEESPFKGSKRFGMVYTDRNGLASIGTILEITQHECCEDGRIIILTRGSERFIIEKVEQEKPVLLCKNLGLKKVERDKPVLLCKVRMIKDKEEDMSTLTELADEVKGLFRDTLRLNARYKKITVADAFLNPKQLDELPPDQLSFWMVSMMAEAAQMQQNILQSDSPRARLEYVRTILVETVKYLSAAVAVEGVMSPSSSPDAPSNPPPGGPD